MLFTPRPPRSTLFPYTTLFRSSAISDNVRVEAPLGTVRAFDARSGKPRWSFDPLIHDGIDAGHANVWAPRSEEHTSELQSLTNLVCRLLLEKKKQATRTHG